MNSPLIGRFVIIKSPGHTDQHDWGIIRSYDGERYHIAIRDDDNAILEFDRDEFTVKRNWNH